jgi:glycosyltransferase involved in cell wall biosynthesis
MRITFAMPSYARAPIGGYRVVYEYANRLSRYGHEVTLLHPRRTYPAASLLARTDVALWRLRNRILDRSRVPWFALEPQVRVAFAPDLSPQWLPDGDVLVATAWQTAPWVASARPSTGTKFYLVQGYETWSGNQAEVDATWKLPMHKIVIAQWLRERAVALGEAERTTYIPNGVDFDQFRLLVPQAERFPRRVGMLHHTGALKGSAEGIAAMRRARERYPDLQCALFGIRPRPRDLPDWIEYSERPSPARLVEFYNRCAIFIQPSWSEGWGLTATEAMACGCALVTTDNGGSRDYARHGETALVVPVRQPDALASALLHLLGDDELRTTIALNGNRYVGRFRWERSAAAMEALFRSAARRKTANYGSGLPLPEPDGGGSQRERDTSSRSS